MKNQRKLIAAIVSLCLSSACLAQAEKGANLVRNSSFENEWNYWTGGYNPISKADLKSLPPDKSQAYDGKHSAKGNVCSYKMKLKPLQKYTLSFYAKGEDGKGRIRALAADCQGKKVISKWFKLTKNWKRFTWTFNVTPAWDDIVGIAIGGRKNGKNNLWIDAVKLEEGETATPYSPSKLSFGLITKRPSRMFLDNEKCVITARVRNAEKKKMKALLTYSIKDYFEEEVLKGEKELELNGEEFEDFPIELDLNKLGLFTADFALSSNGIQGGNKITCFSRLKKPKNSAGLINMHGTWPWLPDDRIEETVEVLEAAGCNFNRIEPNRYIKTPENWDRVRRLAEACKARGLKFLWTIQVPPEVSGKKYDAKNYWKGYEKGNHYIKTKEAEKAWSEYVYNAVKSFKGLIDTWEICNEPSWRYTPEEFSKILKTAYKAAKKANPDCVVFAGSLPSICPVTIDWITQVLDKGNGAEYMDVLSIHPYTRKPESEMIVEGIKKIQDVIKSKGKDIPIVNTENSWRAYHNPRININFYKGLQGKYIGPAPHEYKYNQWEKFVAAYHARMALAHRVLGLKSYAVHAWGMDYGTHGVVKDRQHVLQPTLGMANCLNTLMNGVIDSEKFPLGSVEGYLYKKDNGTILAALWFPSNDETLSIDMKLPDDSDKASVIDIMNNKRMVKNGESIKLTSTPLFFEFRGQDMGQVKEFFSKAKLDIKTPMRFAVDVASAKDLQVTLKNMRIKPIDGKISVEFPASWGAEKTVKDFSGLKSGRKLSLSFPMNMPLDKIVPLKKYPIGINLDTKDGFSLKEEKSLQPVLATKIQKPIVIDGDLKDWEGIEPIIMNKKMLCKSFPENNWSDSKDLEAKLRLAWDKENLYMAVEVDDDVFYQKEKISHAYMGDSLQLLFDTKNNGRTEKREMDLDDYVYNVAMINGKPQSYRSYSADFQESGNRQGPTNMETAIKQSPGKTVYEMKFPARDLYPFQIKADAVMGFSIMINDSDNGKRESALSINPPDKEPWKNTGYFPDLIFVGGDEAKVDSCEKGSELHFSNDGSFYTEDGKFYLNVSKKNGTINIVKNKTPLCGETRMVLSSPKKYQDQSNGILKTTVKQDSKTIETSGKVKEMDFDQKVSLKDNGININIHYSNPKTYSLKKPCFMMNLSEALYGGKEYKADEKTKTYPAEYDKNRPILSDKSKDYESLTGSDKSFKIKVLKGSLRIQDHRAWGKGYSVRIYPEKTEDGGDVSFIIKP